MNVVLLVGSEPTHNDQDRVLELMRRVDHQSDRLLVQLNQVVRKHLGREVASRKDKQGDRAIRDRERTQHCDEKVERVLRKHGRRLLDLVSCHASLERPRTVCTECARRHGFEQGARFINPAKRSRAHQSLPRQ